MTTAAIGAAPSITMHSSSVILAVAGKVASACMETIIRKGQGVVIVGTGSHDPFVEIEELFVWRPMWIVTGVACGS